MERLWWGAAALRWLLAPGFASRNGGKGLNPAKDGGLDIAVACAYLPWCGFM
jgi:hypothetical protein